MAGAEPALGAREPGVQRGCGMSAAVVTVRPPTALALLLTVAAVLLIGSGASYTLLQARSAAGARVLPVDALYDLALDAGAAVAGDAAALTRFQQRQKALEDAAARDPAAPFMSDARVMRLMSNAATVLSARGALAEAGSAARATAALVPRLLTESGALGASLPAPLAPAVTATLERFEARAQRLELDVTALTRGAADPGQAAQRIAESSDYLGQVIAGFAGAGSGLALPRVTQPEAVKRLKALDAIFTDLSASVRRAVAAAPALPAAQSAARAIAMDARDIAAAAAPSATPAAAVLVWAPLLLLAAGLALLIAALVATLRMRRVVERQRVSADAQRRESDRNQQAILRLLDELSSLADGDLTVQATVTEDITGAIPETIQETSKRIKRLGESSQEIGNIVELINDIAEQTNILALNASIQSSMAGEAGRGFAVVADEVQRLAERAANSTKQIEVLVRTIQTDTNEAVVSMERSTTDVVGGALLAENAGAALEEIEQVSNQIASLVQNISGSARQQTHAAQNIARNMQALKEISAQTAESTNATSTAIAKLAELSAGLRKSATGFRLPASPDERLVSSSAVRRVEDATLNTAKVRQISALGGS